MADDLDMTDDMQDDSGKTDAELKADAAEKLAAALLIKRDIAVQGRVASGVERRWMEDEASFDGMDASDSSRKTMVDYAAGALPAASTTEQYRSKLIANIARSKCETAWGRYCDIQLPVDDRNWGLKTTPVPELVKGLKDDRPAASAQTQQPITDPQTGQPVKISDAAKSEMDQARERMEAMESEIDDQLSECGFNGECRKVAWDAIKLGTGILKGPNVIRKMKKSWSKQEDPDGTTAYVLEMAEEYKPTLTRVDPWSVYPDPDCGEDIKRAGYVWEYDTVLPRELVDLAAAGERGGYMVNQIIQILKEKPIRTSVARTKQNQMEITRDTTDTGAYFERWTYNGDVDRDDLLAMGCDCSQDELSPSLSASVEFVNDRPIKVVLNNLDTGDMIYDFFQWTRVSGSVWGIGVPRLQYWWDRVLTAGWRAMLDNAADSAGANIVMGPGIVPADGVKMIGGKKIWDSDGEVDDVRKEVFQWQITNNQAQLEKVIRLALEFIDMETGLPMLFQGEKGEAPETLGATNIMVDSSNVALRGRVKRWDDQITRPALSRMYHYNMQYSDKDNIKGDFNVDARGASVLLARDSQTQAVVGLFNLKGDPDVAKIVDWEKAVRMLAQNQHLDILRDPDEIKRMEEEAKAKAEQGGGQQDPRVAGAMQVAQTRAQGEMEKAKLVQESDMKELELKREIETAGFAFKVDQAALDRQHQIDMKMIERDIEAMRLSAASGMKLEDIKAQLSQTKMKLQTQKELSVGRPSMTREVSEPLTEPTQLAPDGRSYQE